MVVNPFGQYYREGAGTVCTEESDGKDIGITGLQYVAQPEVCILTSVVIGFQHIHIPVIQISVCIIIGNGIENIFICLIRDKPEVNHFALAADLCCCLRIQPDKRHIGN